MTSLDPEGPRLRGPVITAQRWEDAVFLHWRVEPDRLAPLLPRGARPDVFDGAAWVGLVAFRMVGAGVGGGPGVPWLGTFLEVNVRAYTVDGRGRRGVTFLTLESDRVLPVLGARAVLGLSYRWARIRLAVGPGAGDPPVGSVLRYTSRGRPAPNRQVPGRLRRTGFAVRVGERLTVPSPEDLFLTARFGLHGELFGLPMWVPNTHGPWPLHRAEALEVRDELIAWCGLDGVAVGPPQSTLYSPGVATRFGPPEFG